MSNDSAAFDPNTIKARVEERIRQTIGDLVPEHAWQGLIEHHIDAFFRDKQARQGTYGPEVRVPSYLERVVNEEMEKLTRAKVKAYLDEHFETQVWDKEQRAYEAISKIVVENAPEILTNILRREIADVLAGVRNQLG